MKFASPVYFVCTHRYRNSWSMEEWLAFLETFCTFLLLDLPWNDTPEETIIKDAFESQWEHLRFGCLYFLRYHEGQHTANRTLTAQTHLLQYAAEVEEVRFSPLHFLKSRYTLINKARDMLVTRLHCKSVIYSAKSQGWLSCNIIKASHASMRCLSLSRFTHLHPYFKSTSKDLQKLPNLPYTILVMSAFFLTWFFHANFQLVPLHRVLCIWRRSGASLDVLNGSLPLALCRPSAEVL